MTPEEVGQLLALRAAAEDERRFEARLFRSNAVLTIVNGALAITNAVVWRLWGAWFNAIVAVWCTVVMFTVARLAHRAARLRDSAAFVVAVIDGIDIVEGDQ